MRLMHAVVLLCVGAALGGGGAFAAGNMITSAQIKNGTIQLADISPAARAALRGHQGVRGPVGLPGDDAQGIQGPPGIQGPAGIGGLQLVTSQVDIGTSLTVRCPGGKQVLGGGEQGSVPLVASYPSADLSGWNLVPSVAGSQMTGYAICATVAS